MKMVYSCVWRRQSRFQSGFPRTTQSPLRRGGGRRNQISLEDPDATWRYAKIVSREQLRYVRENCAVDAEGVKGERDDPCAICLDVFEVSSPRNVLKLNCNHFFHEVSVCRTTKGCDCEAKV